jgi:crotonobetainyl-CoA:carnitine CoA-transferase CaiB-like acyl-CoA transferase
MNPWNKIVEATGDPDLAVYADPQVLFDRRDEIFEELQKRMLTRSTDEWLEIMLGLDIWCAKVNELKDVEADPQVRHLQAFTEVEHPLAGRVKVTNIPFRMSETPGNVRRPAPLVGQHGREILNELGMGGSVIDALVEKRVVSIAVAMPAQGDAATS